MQHVWGRGQVHTEFGGETSGKEEKKKDIGIKGRMLKWIIQWDGGGMDWTDLAQDMET
jgi:hypothetical protein